MCLPSDQAPVCDSGLKVFLSAPEWIQAWIFNTQFDQGFGLYPFSSLIGNYFLILDLNSKVLSLSASVFETKKKKIMGWEKEKYSVKIVKWMTEIVSINIYPEIMASNCSCEVLVQGKR